jgi:hypothetical protein
MDEQTPGSLVFRFRLASGSGLMIIIYRKPPTISPGLIYFRKRFLMGLYKDGLIYGRAYTWTIFCVSNKQVRHKQVGHKRGNKRVLSSDYWAYTNWGTYIRGAYIRVGLYSGGLYLE